MSGWPQGTPRLIVTAVAGPDIPTCKTLGKIAATTDLDRLNEAGEEMNRIQRLLEGRDTFIVEKGLWNEFIEWLAKRAGQECADV